MQPCLRTVMAGCALPRLESQMLWQHVLGVPRSWLIAHDTDPLPYGALQQYRQLEQRRLDGEPMAYIVGQREFMGHTFRVTPDVLIPRPETELLVECALRHLQRMQSVHTIADKPLRVLDLGTGSGAIALSIALACPQAAVVASDCSVAALAVAKGNADTLGASMQFYCGDWYDALLPGMDFDVIVSNPPYISASDPHLQQGDVRFEPRTALTDDADGLDALRAIVSGSLSRLRPGGAVFLEHGWDQAPGVRHLLRQAGYTNVHSVPDLAGIDRVTGGYFVTSNLEHT